jgi:uncharacterized membrane protein YqjE
MATQGARQGLFASLHNLSGTLLAMLQTRVELLGNELEVETLRILRMLMLAQVLMCTGAIAAVLGVGLLTMWLWELRLGVLAVFCALFLGAAIWSYRALMQMVQRSTSPFDASVAALRDDIQRLRQASSDATTPD